MEHRIIPCAEGDDKFIADKLNAITNSKMDFEDTIASYMNAWQHENSIQSDFCQTANCGRRFLHFDFGVFASLIALSFLSRRIPGGVAA